VIVDNVSSQTAAAWNDPSGRGDLASDVERSSQRWWPHERAA